MLESIFVILLIFAIITLILTVEWESLSVGAINIILWFILGVGILQIQIPYQYTSGGTVVQATHNLESMHPLGYLFIGIGFVVTIYVMAGIVFPMFQGKIKSKRMM